METVPGLLQNVCIFSHLPLTCLFIKYRAKLLMKFCEVHLSPPISPTQVTGYKMKVHK